MRRTAAVLAALAIGIFGMVVGVAGPASATDTTTSCTGVLSGADASGATKSLVSIVDNGGGSYTFTYQVSVTRPADTYRLRDCVWVDTDGNNAYDGETFVGNTDEKDTIFTSDGSGSVTAQTEITLTGLSPDDTVCDRAGVSGTDSSSGLSFTDKTNLLCVPISNPPVVPEVAAAILLPLTGAAVLGGFVLLRRRRTQVAAA